MQNLYCKTIIDHLLNFGSTYWKPSTDCTRTCGLNIIKKITREYAIGGVFFLVIVKDIMQAGWAPTAFILLTLSARSDLDCLCGYDGRLSLNICSWHLWVTDYAPPYLSKHLGVESLVVWIDRKSHERDPRGLNRKKKYKNVFITLFIYLPLSLDIVQIFLDVSYQTHAFTSDIIVDYYSRF